MKILGLSYFRPGLRKLLDSYYGREPKLHKIPFGPLKGEKIMMSFNDSPAMFFGYHELNLIKLVKRIIKHDHVVYDVGSHLGYTCLAYSKLIGHQGSIHAFEVINRTFNMLKCTIDNMDQGNQIYIYNIGLGSKIIEKEYIYDDRKMGSILYKKENIVSKPERRFITNVTIYPLDQYITLKNLDPPNFIKVDIEGDEINFLMGASETITQYEPDMLIEFRDIEILNRGYNYLSDKGYTMVAEGGKIINQTLLNNISDFFGDCFCYKKGKYNNVIF